jgi:alpha-L-fucosidase
MKKCFLQDKMMKNSSLRNVWTLLAFILATVVPVIAQEELTIPYADGPFKPDLESFKQYKCPDWFRDVKFGIWSHWGPQAVPRQGDWYARKMYQEGSPHYKYHVEHYGHPSKFGYKDIIPLWKAEKWEPDKLMALYKKAGARYFVSMGTHVDNFFLWNSGLHKWNAVNYGPKKDIVAAWKKAAEKQGLRFGISEHLAYSYTWLQPSHLADSMGAMKGVPYDGNDPGYQDLYHPFAARDNNPSMLSWNTVWQKEWYTYIRELIDKYNPDLLYSDCRLPFGNIGESLVAHYYNSNIKKNGGMLDAVYNCKQKSFGGWVEDLERGVMDTISPFPWQTDTSIGDWFYRTGQEYKTSTEIIQMLVDIVSKNGNLLINVVQTPEGDIEPDMLRILDEIGEWMNVNGEGIYGTRPWVIYGEKPTDRSKIKGGSFNENKLIYTEKDIRFTTKENVLYAFCLGKPTGSLEIKSLGKNSEFNKKTINSVQLIGGVGKTEWKQLPGSLNISMTGKLPGWDVICFRITFKN